MLRKMIYGTEPNTQKYLQQLSRIYFLLFMLRNEPRVVEFFNSMAEHLVLYVGSDLLIKALSEYYSPVSAQLTINALNTIQKAGAKLILTEPALEEIFTHIKAVDLEFRNNYAAIEPLVTAELIPALDRILIRSYFYAKIGMNTTSRAPRGWKSFIGQFCTHGGLQSDTGQTSLRDYLCDRFRMDYEPRETMLAGVDDTQLSGLTDEIIALRGFRKKARTEILAANDALHVLRVFGKRSELKEEIVTNPFGFRTWWLTHERTVRRAAGVYFKGKRSQFVMRPEFLLNYIAFSPSKKAVSDSYKAIFPTLLRVRLSHRVDKSYLQKMLGDLRQVYEVDDHRACGLIRDLSDKLKSDQVRIYESNWDTNEVIDEFLLE